MGSGPLPVPAGKYFSLMPEPVQSDVRGLPQSQWPAGMIEAPNTNLHDRPTVRNPDNTTSSVRSMSFEVNGKEILVPTVSDDGRIMSDDESKQQYLKTGKHLGVFDHWQNADKYAEQLHNDYAAGKYGGQRRGGDEVPPQMTPFNMTVPNNSPTLPPMRVPAGKRSQ
jgi:hypothetical protein